MVTALMVAGAVSAGARRRETRLIAGAVAIGLVFGGTELAAWTLLLGVGFTMARRALTLRVAARNASQLPELADELAASLSSQRDIARAMARGRRFVVGDDLVPYDECVQALELGAPAEIVFAAWSARQPGVEWSVVVAALALSSTTSSPRPLRDVAVLLRVRRLRREDVATQVAQAKASAIVVSSAPWVVLGVTAILDPGYVADLVRSSVGRLCLLAAGSLTLVGAVGMRAAIHRSGLA